MIYSAFVGYSKQHTVFENVYLPSHLVPLHGVSHLQHFPVFLTNFGKPKRQSVLKYPFSKNIVTENV